MLETFCGFVFVSKTLVGTRKRTVGRGTEVIDRAGGGGWRGCNECTERVPVHYAAGINSDPLVSTTVHRHHCFHRTFKISTISKPSWPIFIVREYRSAVSGFTKIGVWERSQYSGTPKWARDGIGRRELANRCKRPSTRIDDESISCARAASLPSRA